VTVVIVAIVWCVAALLFALFLGPALRSVSPPPAKESPRRFGDDLLDQPAVDHEARPRHVAGLG
jgi:hypothetical protein